MKKRNGLLACLCIVLALLCACGKSSASWQEQYDLGVRYLNEGNYQEAILAFEAAIEIDPARAEAYAQLAGAYLAINDPESARSALERGVATTGDEGLQVRLEELEGLAAEPVPSGEPAPGDGSVTGGESQDGDALVGIDGAGYHMSLSLTAPGLPEAVWHDSTGQVDCGIFSVTISDGTRSYLVGTYVWDQDAPAGLCAVPNGPACSQLLREQSGGYFGDPLNVAVTAGRTGDTITWSFEMPEAGFPVEDIREVSYYWHYRSSPEEALLRGQYGVYAVRDGGLALTESGPIEMGP